MTTRNRSVAGVLVAVLGVGIGIGGTAMAGSAEPDSSARAISKAKVKKIAKQVANQQITQRAPSLSVANAQNAVNAQNATSAASAVTAQNAINAQFAANAGKVGNLDVKKFNATILNNGADVVLTQVAGLTLTGSCPLGVPRVVATAPNGKIRFARFDDGNLLATDGTNNLGSIALTGAAVLGSVAGEYTSTAGATASVWFGFRNDGGACNLFGNALGG